MSGLSLPDSFKFSNEESNIVTGTGEVLIDKKKDGKERPWNVHKTNSKRLYGLYTLARKVDPLCITDSAYTALADCASFLLFKVGSDGGMKLKKADFCRTRLCPMCNWRKSLKMFGQASKITKRMLEKYPTTRFIFVTLTARNCNGSELANTIKMINTGFSMLTAKSRKLAASAKFKKSLLGYLKAMEVTYNKQENTYHPHIHVIFAVKASYFKGESYIKQADWQKAWQTCLGIDYEPIVNVKVIKEQAQKGLAGAVAETAKYPVKVQSILDLEEDKAVKVIITLANALKNKRLVTFGGLFAEIRKELELDDIESGDLIHADDEEEPMNEVAQVLFKYKVRVGCYVC